MQRFKARPPFIIYIQRGAQTTALARVYIYKERVLRHNILPQAFSRGSIVPSFACLLEGPLCMSVFNTAATLSFTHSLIHTLLQTHT